MSKKLKLTNLSETEMKKTKGGHAYEVHVHPGYSCGCYYAGSGGSSSGGNLSANDDGHLWS